MAPIRFFIATLFRADTLNVQMTGLFSAYEVAHFFDEMFSAPGEPRPHYRRLLASLGELGPGDFERKRTLAATSFPPAGRHLHRL